MMVWSLTTTPRLVRTRSTAQLRLPRPLRMEVLLVGVSQFVTLVRVWIGTSGVRMAHNLLPVVVRRLVTLMEQRHSPMVANPSLVVLNLLLVGLLVLVPVRRLLVLLRLALTPTPKRSM